MGRASRWGETRIAMISVIPPHPSTVARCKAAQGGDGQQAHLGRRTSDQANTEPRLARGEGEHIPLAPMEARAPDRDSDTEESLTPLRGVPPWANPLGRVLRQQSRGRVGPAAPEAEPYAGPNLHDKAEIPDLEQRLCGGEVKHRPGSFCCAVFVGCEPVK